MMDYWIGPIISGYFGKELIMVDYNVSGQNNVDYSYI
jgi:hypothetical protein